tara:strand:+ start:460 stop:786 length:327 start_codon:yes stop_codon:yes gene_type:complete
MLSEFVNVKGVADHFKVSERLIRTWVSQGKIPNDTYVHIQQTYRFNLAAVEAALLADRPAVGTTEDTSVWTDAFSDPEIVEELDEEGGKILTADNIGTWGDMSDEKDL